MRFLLAQRHFNGNLKAFDNWAAKMVAEKYLKIVPNALPGGHNLYMLTRQACQALSISDARSQAIGPRAITPLLGVLWYCQAYTGIKRYRLERERIEKITGYPLDGTHVLEAGYTKQNKPITRLYRVYCPGEHAQDAYTVNQVTKALAELRSLTERKNAAFSPAELLWQRRYAIAVLVTQPERVRSMTDALKERGVFEETHCQIELVPSPETLGQFLKELTHAQAHNDDTDVTDEMVDDELYYD